MAALVCMALLLVPLFCANGQQSGEDEEVLRYLDRTIAWFRDVAAVESGAERQNETLFADNLRDSSIQALRFAFQSARAYAAFPIAKSQRGAAPDDTRSRNLMQARTTAEQRMAQVQTRIDEIDREMKSARPGLRQSLQAKRDKLEGDFNLAKARQGSLRNLTGLLNNSDAGLTSKIDDLEHSVPELAKAQTTATAAAAVPRAAATRQFHADSAGIVGLTTELFSISRRRSRLDSVLRSTDELSKAHDSLRAPLRSSLREIIGRGDAIAKLPESNDPSELIGARKELDGLLERFKLLSAALAPSGQVTTALNISRANLVQWRGAVSEEYSGTLRYLLLRLGVLGFALLVIFFFSELWRRGTIRYVQDMRRRRQFLLLRRIVIGCTMALFVILSFVTEFSSIATFAGFSAAGIALAMQSVILSVVAYFFLVGRWGVRVGDRVTVSGVTGDVIDIGLFRLYLLEVAGSGLDLHPTGRIVVFPNAVFFQQSALFKQFPGIDYTWCTISLTMASDCDYVLLEKRLLAAVESVYAEYREDIERQYRAAQSSMDLHTAMPRPEGSLRFTNDQIEFVVRCPVHIRRMAEVADRLTRELVAEIEKEPRLILTPGTAPKIQMLAPSSATALAVSLTKT